MNDDDTTVQMSQDEEDRITARRVWTRFSYMRDNGHLDFVKKAETCENFFAGMQWTKEDQALLKAQRRPALTINKVLPIISNLLGGQVFNRTDTVFKPRNEGATAEVADALTKVFLQISDNNELTWVRSDVFMDGLITSRGFYDVRLDTEDSKNGEVRITHLNPKNVMIDPDADSYNPRKWNDVLYSEWWTADDIELKFGKDKADALRTQACAAYGDDALGDEADRFGDGWNRQSAMGHADDNPDMHRHIRVLDYQYRKTDRRAMFMDTQTGDFRPVPDGWEEGRIQAFLNANENVVIEHKLVKRIRWVIVAGDTVLYEAWSPYENFTIVPYFPHFIRGRTIGIVENLVGSQELLNKTSSQELHIVNTTANSGYYVKRNSLQNMSVAELEERGSQTGLVVELDDMASIQKIPPNQTPSGLDRISYKAEEHIKSISGVSDYMTGFAREDVSAKAVRANQAGGSANTAHLQDSLNRSDYLLANNILSLVQSFYTEERLVRITTDRLRNKTEELTVNQKTPEGDILNDLTVGEYGVVISNQPDRDTFEETQYDQALALRTDAGVQIPDKYLIQASRLKDKAEIIDALEGNDQSPEAQEQAQFQMEYQRRMMMAELMDKEADAKLKGAQAEKALAMAKAAGDGEAGNSSMEYAVAQEKLAFEREKLAAEIRLKKYEVDMKVRTELEVERMRMQEKLQGRLAEQAAADNEKAEVERKQREETFAEEADAFAQDLQTKADAARQAMSAKAAQQISSAQLQTAQQVSSAQLQEVPQEAPQEAPQEVPQEAPQPE